ncbi:MAG TPA: hypothetical protein DCW72_06290 [Elusimicrobia bacterium]|nr:hypothetical protein [Elusimicrobiota bacterium]
MPPLSGARRGPSAPLEAAEQAWAAELGELLRAPAALRVYAAAGKRRAADFELSKTAALWADLLAPRPTT